MTTKKETFSKLPSVVSLQRNAVISDAKMYSVVDGEFKAYPVEVIRHGIRGTQNINKSAKSSGETSGSVEPQDVRLLQITDSAKLHPEAEALVVEYSFGFLDLEKCVSSIAPGKTDDDQFIEDFNDSLTGFIARAKQGNGLKEIANRYARNTLNGRWLWRNRAEAHDIRIEVYKGESLVAQADALDLPLTNFDDYTDQELLLGDLFYQSLQGKSSDFFIVRARLTLLGRGAIEVYPSQNYIDKKKGAGKKGELARSLYVYGHTSKNDTTGPNRVGYAAIRDQKIGNALRTIDTWYEDGSEPIAVEPYGANLATQKFYRLGKSSAFSFMKRMNDIDVNHPEGMFLSACMIRGGVFSEVNNGA